MASNSPKTTTRSEIERLIFSCEFLTPKEILEKNVPKLLAETGVALCMRTMPRDLENSGDFKAMLSEFKNLGIEQQFIPWPMLEVEDGYYANVKTAAKFSTMMKRTLDWYCDNKFEIPLGVVIDLEPSTDPDEAKKAEAFRKEGKKPEKKGMDIMSTVGKIIDQIDGSMDPGVFESGSREFTAMQDMMHGYGTKAIAVALPLAYEDIFDDKLLIQQFMTCPVTSVDWDMINFMVFNTDYVAATKGLISNDDYRHLIYTYGKEFITKWGKDKPSITMGITNVGITDIRAVQTDPGLYRLEASALLAAGMVNMGIYALDGVLQQPDPKAWIETVKQAKASDFKPEPDRLEMADNIRRAFRAIDFIYPVGQYLVKSGKIMNIIQMVTSGALKF
ncbi:MAG: hypothetical protein GYA24_14420 [Candidatus Lokiarchaeota archaeon]|nr:hypothetical protein [Candidatus Lokiarchaeota archaeon]